MELTRRDALVAVAAGTAGVATAGQVAEHLSESAESAPISDALPGLVAVAEVVYPTEVEVTEAFLETYVTGRELNQDSFSAATQRAYTDLDQRSKQRYGRSFKALSREQRDTLLRDIGVANAASDPDGTELERVRYYLVNELLYALYTSPTGGRLLDAENPPGYPGGRQAYQQGPEDE